MKRTGSILQSDCNRCYICGRCDEPLEKHHIFGAANRRLSEEDGLYVWICGSRCHREGPMAVHRNSSVMDAMHKAGYKAYTKKHNREEFRGRYGRYYD